MTLGYNVFRMWFFGKEDIKVSEYTERVSLHIRTVYCDYHSGGRQGYQDETVIKGLENESTKDC